MTSLDKRYFKNITLEQALIGGKFRIQLEDGSTVKVILKPGSYTGQVIRLKREEDPISKKLLKDTLITLNVLDHPMYRIDGLNLEAIVVLTAAEVKMGTSKKLPGPDGGFIEINIPKDSKQDQKIVIKEKGLRQKYLSGDIIFQIKIGDFSFIEDKIKFKLESSDKQGILH